MVKKWLQNSNECVLLSTQTDAHTLRAFIYHKLRSTDTGSFIEMRLQNLNFFGGQS